MRFVVEFEALGLYGLYKVDRVREALILVFTYNDFQHVRFKSVDSGETMLMSKRNRWLLMSYVFLLSFTQAGEAYASEKSFQFGLMHPSGVNLIGYSVERHIDDKLYWYYTIGVPSLLAIGITHYSRRDGNGLTSTLGAGLGYPLYASIAYQVKLGNKNFLKLGATLALATYYPFVSSEESYAVYPLTVIAYEYRF